MRHFYKTALTLAAISAVSLCAQARPVVVRGSLMTGDTSGTIYEIDSEGSKTQLSSLTSHAASGGGTYFNNVYYMSKVWMSGYSSQTMSFNTQETPWKVIDTDGDGSSTVLSTDYAYDGVEGVIYGFHKQSGTNYVIGKITPGATWSRKLVQVQKGPDMVDVKIDCSNADNRWHGLAFDAANQLWVITYGGVLNKVDKTTGAMTVVGETGIKPTVNGSAAFDMKTGKLYWAAKNASGSAVYEVNTTTAAATKVIDVPDNQQLMGIYIPEPAAEDGAPAQPVNVRYAFEGGSLSGKLLFDVPATTFDDKAASGEVAYTVTIADGTPVTGTTTFGATAVEVPFSVQNSGKVAAQVVLKNSVGDSPATKYEGYVGFGKPVAPAGVQLAYADGKMKLSWEPVTAVVDGEGYLGDVKYMVVRKVGADSQTLAEATDATQFEEEVAEPESGIATYNYEVTAINGDMKSDAPGKASTTIGSVALPYENTFDTADDFKSLIAINAESSSKTWVYNSSTKNVTIGYDRAYAKDDWMITPPVQLHKDYVYTVSVSAKSNSSRYPEKVALAWGLAPTSEGMSEVILAPETVPATATVYEARFTAPETTKAYIGVHACSDMDMSTLTIDDFKISETIPVGVGVDSAVADSEATITVNGKTITVNGNARVMIAAIDGTIVCNAECDGSLSKEVNAGIYVVNVGGKTVKVIVK